MGTEDWNPSSLTHHGGRTGSFSRVGTRFLNLRRGYAGRAVNIPQIGR